MSATFPKDSGCRIKTNTPEVRRNSVYLLEALQWLFRGVRFSEISLRDDCTWTPRWLAAAALLWVWSGESTLRERFARSRRLVAHLRGDDVQLRWFLSGVRL
ncbi:MAG: hypothetical protein R3C02_03700 [Planctomycetaceae bacterium]